MRRRLGLAAGCLVAVVLATVAPADAVPVNTRVADGVDRYETAVELSFAFFPTPPVPVVYVASGENFPDALAAGAAAADDGGPVLLTRRDSLPQVTKDELFRLKPGKIVLVGGPGAVSDAVKDALQAYVVAPVSRVQGQTRFDTSAAVSLSTFSPGVPVAYVASGEKFPDALSGSAAAGTLGGPVLLVAQGAIPSTVGQELDRLNPGEIVILGGIESVGIEVQGALVLANYAPVDRVAGTDRYATAALLSASVFATGGAEVFIVTGENFPDGLAAGAVAGGRNAPVLLTRRDCMPKATADEITRLAPTDKVWFVGGPQAIALNPQNTQAVCT
jgi:putative cell wall-binding protein